MMVTQFCEYSKNHRTIHLKWVNCMIREFYFNEAVTNFPKLSKQKALPVALVAPMSSLVSSPQLVWLVRSAFPSSPSPSFFRTQGLLSPLCSLCSSHAGLLLSSASGPLPLLSLLLRILFLTFSVAPSLTSSSLGLNVTTSSEVFPSPHREQRCPHQALCPITLLCLLVW